MKTSHFSLILVSAFSFGCASTNPKVAADATRSISPAPTVQQVSVYPPDLFAQDIISLETGLACTNGFHFDLPDMIVVIVSPPPRQIPSVVSPFDVRRRDMSLIDDTGTR